MKRRFVRSWGLWKWQLSLSFDIVSERQRERESLERDFNLKMDENGERNIQRKRREHET